MSSRFGRIAKISPKKDRVKHQELTFNFPGSPIVTEVEVLQGDPGDGERIG